MAITSAEIHNQSFSIDRKGYDVDEVDVFLEHVADEIDGMNAQIIQLENQLDDRKFDGFDTPARTVEMPVVDDSLLAEKDERIADLERQLEAKKADDNAIAQALIIAQRSADEIIANANAQSAATIKDAEEAARLEQVVLHNPISVAGVKKRVRKQKPPLPFTTSTLQQEAYKFWASQHSAPCALLSSFTRGSR